MLVKTYCAAVNGLEVTTVTAEVSMSRGIQFHLTGLADTAVKESYDRIKAALVNNGFKMPSMDITINLSPADIKKEAATCSRSTAYRYQSPCREIQRTYRSQTEHPRSRRGKPAGGLWYGHTDGCGAIPEWQRNF